MSSHSIEQDEDIALFEAIKAGGEYLDSLNVHDLRYLDRGKLLLFTAHIISRYAAVKPDFMRDAGTFDDEIPF